MTNTTVGLRAEDVRLAYGERVVIDGVSVAIPQGAFTVIIGPNACGKSTLLRALARLLPPERGRVLLDGRDIHSLSTKAVARRVGFLPQQQTAPGDLRVRDLVMSGRFPHQSFFSRISDDDVACVQRAMELTGVLDLQERKVEELSGGQRQRAWLATAIAQDTEILLLDEPTTYLDLVHQLEVLRLCASIQKEGRTVVAVLHDLNLAARCADHVIVMSAGEVIAQGTPREVYTEQMLGRAFGLDCRIIDDPETGTPLVIPAASTTATS